MKYLMILVLLMVAACAKDEVATQSGSVLQPQAVTMPVQSDWQYAVNANLTLQKMQMDQRLTTAAACSAGLANAKSDMQFALAILGQQACLAGMAPGSQPTMAIQAPPEKAPPPSLWDRALQVTDRLLMVWGIKIGSDERREQTRANRDVMTQAFQTTGAIATSGFQSNSSIANAGFTALGQQPVPSWAITAGGDVMVGNGNSATRTTTTTTTTDRHDVSNAPPIVVTCVGTPPVCTR